MQCLAVSPIIVYAESGGIFYWPEISNLLQFTSMHPKSKKTVGIKTGLLAYTFIKLADDLTNNDRDILTDISNST